MGRSPPPRSDELDLGFVSGVFGTGGEVRLHLHNPDSDLLRAPREVVLVAPDGARRQVTLSARPGAGRRILGRIAGVEDRGAAADLMGHRVRIAKDALPPVAPGEVYVWQLEGLEVRVGGAPAGTVAQVHRAGPVDVLEIDTGGEPAFVPVVGGNVERVDLDAGVVHLAPGVLDEG